MKTTLWFFILLAFSTLNTFAQEQGKVTTPRFLEVSEELLEHYQNDPDARKLKAAKFLLDNIPYHKSLVCYWIAKNGKQVEIEEEDFNTYEAFQKELKNIQAKGAKPRIAAIYDAEFVTTDFLIKNIDYSFELWDRSGWKDAYTFEQFCEYLLPYRNAVEPVREGWREDYNLLYREAYSKAADKNDPVEVCSEVVNKMKYFEFTYSRFSPQPLLSLDQIHFRQSANCPDLANAAVLNCRALGLVTTFDFTPAHAASSNAHFWNTVVNLEGNHIPFNGSQTPPYSYDATKRRLGKVLRHTYSAQKEALPNFVKTSDIPNDHLSYYTAIDVTSEYVETIDINYKYNKKLADQVGYISVYNKGRWKPIWWSKIDSDGHATFKDMGVNVVYLPSLVVKKTIGTITKNKIIHSAYPIQVAPDGQITRLVPNFEMKTNCTLSRQNEHVAKQKDFNTLEIIDKNKYKLFYWQKGWQLLMESEAKNDELSFQNLPNSALFKLEPQSPDRFERVFTIDNSQCRIIWF